MSSCVLAIRSSACNTVKPAPILHRFVAGRVVPANSGALRGQSHFILSRQQSVDGAERRFTAMDISSKSFQARRRCLTTGSAAESSTSSTTQDLSNGSTSTGSGVAQSSASAPSSAPSSSVSAKSSIDSPSSPPPSASSPPTSSPERIPRVTLFTGGPECSLCEIMKQDLAIVQMTHPFELRVWNIHDPAERERELGEKERRRAERYKQAYLFEIPVLHMNGKYIGRHRLNATTFKKQLEAYRSGDELFHIAHLTPSRETIRRRGGDPLKFQVEREEHLKRVEANQAKRLAHLDDLDGDDDDLDQLLGEPWAGEEDAVEGAAKKATRPKHKLSRRAKKRPTESWTPPTNVDGTRIRRGDGSKESDEK